MGWCDVSGREGCSWYDTEHSGASKIQSAVGKVEVALAAARKALGPSRAHHVTRYSASIGHKPSNKAKSSYSEWQRKLVNLALSRLALPL